MTSSKFQILVPLEFTTQSAAVFNQACRIAQIYDAAITVLHVVENEAAYLHHYNVNSKTDLIQKIDNELKEFVKTELAFSKIIVSCRIEFGEIAHNVLSIQEKENYQMIVLGFNDLKNPLQKQIGSNAYSVIKQAKCQVIAIKKSYQSGEFKSIILPLDLTKPYGRKVEKVIELAKSWKGSIVTVISVLPQCDELKVNAATNQLAAIVREIEGSQVKCNAEIIRMVKGRESTADIIADYAHRIKSEMVMMIARQDESNVKRLGLAAQGIINSVDIPILSIVPLVNQN